MADCECCVHHRVGTDFRRTTDFCAVNSKATPSTKRGTFTRQLILYGARCFVSRCCALRHTHTHTHYAGMILWGCCGCASASTNVSMSVSSTRVFICAREESICRLSPLFALSCCCRQTCIHSPPFISGAGTLNELVFFFFYDFFACFGFCFGVRSVSFRSLYIFPVCFITSPETSICSST